jgi:hypothetical protein
MKRRDFFAWIGKAAAAVGLGSIVFDSDINESMAMPIAAQPNKNSTRIRMTGRACHDFRKLSADQSILLDRDVFSA